MQAVHQRPRPPEERRNAANGQQSCADSIPTTLHAVQQAEQTTNRIESEDARWRANNFCADCGKYVADGFAACSSQKAHRRGPIWCERCSTRRELSR